MASSSIDFVMIWCAIIYDERQEDRMNNNNHHSLLTADLHEAESVDDLQVDTSKIDPASQSTHEYVTMALD